VLQLLYRASGCYPGENQRERVPTAEEEQQYFQAAVELGRQLDDAYGRALQGTRATRRGVQPKPPDAYLLRDVSTILMGCGLRPEECHRLRWENIRDGAVEIFTGRRKASRRRIPASPRVLFILDMRQARCLSDWLFPADTRSGHIETGTLKKQHSKSLTPGNIPAFVPCDLRHTSLTRWAKVMDLFTLKKLAGHTDLNTTMRNVHRNDQDRAGRHGKGTGWAQKWAQSEFDGF